MRTKVFLALALLLNIGGVLLGRLLHFSEFASVGMGVVPSMLIAFPLMKHLTGDALTFKVWAFSVGLGVLSTWLIYLVIGT